jgi:NhaA family Na+:H+ antiporter
VGVTADAGVTANPSSGATKAGFLLAAAALAGLAFENVPPLAPLYDSLLTLRLTVAVENAAISKPLLLWINDGLMAVFFLLVAMEIKREANAGALRDWARAALPVYGALGGIAVPAAIFLLVVGPGAPEARGWAIPAATDIAFAMGVLSLFGSRVPVALRSFLLALAVVDDLLAIIIIAVFYTVDLSTGALVLAGLALAALAALNLLGVRRIGAYVLVGLVLWACVLESGVHATLAGVALGFAIPIAPGRDGHSLLEAMEHALHPWVAFLVMPLFAFANAGLPLSDLSPGQLADPLTLAVLLGLFVGKQAGVFGAAWAAIRLGLARPPEAATLMQLYGVSLLAGIGFTMSLFIGTLAFEDPGHQNAVRLGVLAGSLLSGVCGAIVLGFARRPEPLPQAAPPAGG